MNHSNDKDTNLANENDILDLLIAEYEAKKPEENTLEKARNWQAIEKKIPNRKPKAWLWTPLLVAAMLLIILIPSLPDDSEPFQNIKGSASTQIQAQLEAFVVKKGGTLEPYQGEAQGTIVFKASVPQPAYVALLLRQGNDRAEVRFLSSETLTGQGRLIERDGKTYGYQLDQQRSSLEFCLMAASDLKELERRTQQLSEEWSHLDKTSCLKVSAP